jgi:exopolyphosphatase/guanosine-5'-triphosphate,3'-diphosphate pyrophosphatase
LRVISGDQEAILAFQAAATALRSDGRNLIVWDIGGGSLQFSMRAIGSKDKIGDYIISSGHHGAELFRKEVAQRFRRDASRPGDPLTEEGMTQAIGLARRWSRDMNTNIVKRLRLGHMRVVGLGGIHTESLSAQAGLQAKSAHEVYTREGVRVAAKRAANMSDADFRNAYPANKYPESQATNVALVLGYMEDLQIKEVIPLDVNLADGLLVDPTYWR